MCRPSPPKTLKEVDEKSKTIHFIHASTVTKQSRGCATTTEDECKSVLLFGLLDNILCCFVLLCLFDAVAALVPLPVAF